MTDKESRDVAVVVQKEVQPLVKIAQKIEIVDADSMEEAVAMLSKLNQIHDRIEEEENKVLDPLKLAMKAEKGRWAGAKKLHEEAIGLLRGKMSTYQTAEVRRVKEEEAKIASRVGAGKGKLKFETAVEKIENIDRVEKKVVTSEGLVKFRTDKKLKITDQSKIPNKFWAVDEGLLLDALKRGDVVPGAEIEEIQVPINYR